MNILMVSSEALPFVKTGGLADVVYSLSKQLIHHHHQLHIILPLYESIRQTNPSLRFIGSSEVFLSWRKQHVDFYHLVESGLNYYFVANDYYFKREHTYGYDDDHERFAFFTLSIRHLIKLVKITMDVIHIHDWQAGMLPALLKEQDQGSPAFKHTKIVLTIHNPAFQGWLDRHYLHDFYNLPFSLYETGKVRFHEGVSTLKSAIVYSDKITTVSPTHAKELLTEEGGYGLHQVLRYVEDDFSGILNGIDASWSPAIDQLIEFPFEQEQYLISKPKNKIALFKRLNLIDASRPLFGLVSRLTWQKGIDLVIANLVWIIEQGGTVVILGTGETALENQIKQLAERYPQHCYFYIGYDEELAHQIYASSDFFLMPSLFEPCGISQMVSLRYGTLPIVRKTGGLVDTIIPYDGKMHNDTLANGIMFEAYSPHALQIALKEAFHIFHQPKLKHALIMNGFQQQHSWEVSAEQYHRLYQSLFKQENVKI